MSLVLKGVSKQFENSDKATLNQIDLEIQKGEFVCLVGTSGCGKSTLLNLVAGLEHPTGGSILLDGREVTGPGADRTVMFQDHGLYPWLTVMENVTFGMKLAGMPKEEREKRRSIIWIWFISRNTEIIPSIRYPGNETENGPCQGPDHGLRRPADG